MITENHEFKLSLKTIIIVLFTLTTIVGSAVFVVTQLSMNDKNSALEISISEKTKEIKEKGETIIKLNSLVNSNNFIEPIPSTLKILDSNNENEELKNKILAIEKERNDLLNELIKNSYNKLDPKSELAILIKELQSDSKEIRKNGVKGLFVLKDPKSINALIDFYFKNLEEAKNFESEFKWIWLIKNMNLEAGLDFAIEIMKNNDDYVSYWGYRFLSEDIREKQTMEIIIKKLNPIALNNSNSLVRTRAKQLISNYTEIINGKKELPDNRSMFDVLLDIENKVNKINK